MRARDIMSTPAVTVTPQTAVKAADDELARRGFTALPVVNDDDALVGIVTEADLMTDRFPTEPHPAGRTVAEVMTAPARSVDVNTGAAQLARLMLDEHRQVATVLAESVPGILRARCCVGETEHE